MVKSYKAHTRLSAKQVNALLQGKTVSHHPSIENDDSNDIFEIEYPTLKARNKIHNMTKKGKGIRLNPHEMADIRIHRGDGFFDSLKKAFSNPIAKSIIKTVAPIAINAGSQMAGTAIGRITGNQEMGNTIAGIGADLANKGVDAYAGSGIRGRGRRGKGFLDSFKKVMKSDMAKQVIKVAQPIAMDLAKKAITKGVTKVTGNENLGNTIGNVASNLGNKAIDKYTSQQAPQQEYVEETEGNGFRGRGRRGKGITNYGNGITGYEYRGRGSQLNHAITIGAEPDLSRTTTDLRDRMRHVRSFRRRGNL